MSDFGVILLFSAGLVLLLGMIWFFAKLTDIMESGGFRALLRRNFDYYAERRVNTFSPAPQPTSDHSVNLEARTATDGDGRTDGRRVSEALQWMERLEVDRTRSAIIELMVYRGWKVEQIRSLVKGENSTISVEVAAARKRLGITEVPRAIAVSGRGGESRQIPMGPELTYQPPPGR